MTDDVNSQEYRSKVGTKVTGVALIVNLMLTAVKIFIGYLFQSMALVADGLHSFSDLASDLFIIVSFQFSKKPADEKHNYGHGKIDVMSEVMVSVILLFVAVSMIRSAVNVLTNITEANLIEPSIFVLGAAVVSIASKEWMYKYTMKYAKKLDSGVLKVNAIHHRTDSFSSIAVLIGLGAAKLLGGKWLILDPIIAIVVAIYIIKIGVQVFVKSYYYLIDGAISETEYTRVMNIINNTPGVSDPHNIRTRKIGNTVAVECHIRVDANMSVKDAHDKSMDIERKLRQEFGKETFVSIHIEPVKVNGEYR